MRHGRTFRKRCLTFLLSLAMVLTSVNVPLLTVWAEEDTSIENENSDTTTLPGENDGDEQTVPVDGNEDNGTSGEVTTPDDGQNPVGGYKSVR